MARSSETIKKGSNNLPFVSPAARIAIYSESVLSLFKQKIIEKKVARGSARGMKVKARFPIMDKRKPTEISRLMSKVVRRKSSKVSKKSTKNTTLTTRGRMKFAAR